MRAPLQRELPDAEIRKWPDEDVSDADFAVCWRPPHGVMAGMPKLRLVHCIAAGVDNILADPDLPDLPLCRVVDENHARGMAEYVLWSVLHFHRRLDSALRRQAEGVWAPSRQRAAGDVTVGIMGWGNIGRSVGCTLNAFGYKVRGWARTPREEEGIELFTGAKEREDFLRGTEILICLLPLTEETRGILDADLFAGLPKGAAVVNIGRGEQLNEPDLLAALDAGHLRGAVLDVFEQEPLPPENPLWAHPRVIVTPHIASTADPRTIAAQIGANIRHALAGEALVNEVDRHRGY
ncbi:glyoxylate/hydroxypyruvate reductase A [Breoghania corrubedonensis]|uniref:Glyoxylate/hydroxypyruvate reductase A n=2 Tax=Breoghania corrubedonensis TaxID=665038 RepID=A0A2T5V5F1_9HYPH|nr:glyoxylate/hydroxypyruvate reductase A [Breoghania corrubedonensis]